MKIEQAIEFFNKILEKCETSEHYKCMHNLAANIAGLFNLEPEDIKIHIMKQSIEIHEANQRIKNENN
jgi:hypothetical protein